MNLPIVVDIKKEILKWYLSPYCFCFCDCRYHAWCLYLYCTVYTPHMYYRSNRSIFSFVHVSVSSFGVEWGKKRMGFFRGLCTLKGSFNFVCYYLRALYIPKLPLQYCLSNSSAAAFHWVKSYSIDSIKLKRKFKSQNRIDFLRNFLFWKICLIHNTAKFQKTPIMIFFSCFFDIFRWHSF